MDDPGGPTVTALLSAWNRRQFVEEAIESARERCPPGVEIAVVSNLRWPELERSVLAGGGRWIFSEEPSWGAMLADGIRGSSGELLAFLDDDDLWAPGRLAHLQSTFADDPRLAFYHNGQIPFREGERPVFLEDAVTPRPLRISEGKRDPRLLERAWLMGAGYNASSIAVRRALVENHLEELRRIHEGVPAYLFYRAWSSGGAIQMDPHPRTAVRDHRENASARAAGAKERFRRLQELGPELWEDAQVILRELPPGTWAVPLEQMAALSDLLAVPESSARPRYRAGRAVLQLLRRRRIWLPRWPLVAIGLARIGWPGGAWRILRRLGPSSRS